MLRDIIAWASLAFSGIAISISIHVARKQAQWIDRQLANDNREANDRLKANVRARLVRSDGWSGRGAHHTIVITNDGPSDARNIDLAFTRGESPLANGERKDKLPIPILQVGGELELIAAVSMSCHPPFAASLTWTDASGPREQQLTIA